jgi:hypothetical protein
MAVLPTARPVMFYSALVSSGVVRMLRAVPRVPNHQASTARGPARVSLAKRGEAVMVAPMARRFAWIVRHGAFVNGAIPKGMDPWL